MSFNYTPKTDEEIASMQSEFLCENGDYPFEVNAASEYVSEKGNDTIKLEQTFWAGDRKIFVYTYLIATDNWQWLVKHFCAATGLLDEYSKGTFNASMCQGRQGMGRLKLQPASGKFKAKMVVEDYLPAAEGEQAQPKQAEGAPF